LNLSGMRIRRALIARRIKMMDAYEADYPSNWGFMLPEAFSTCALTSVEVTT